MGIDFWRFVGGRGSGTCLFNQPFLQILLGYARVRGKEMGAHSDFYRYGACYCRGTLGDDGQHECHCLCAASGCILDIVRFCILGD